MKVLVADRMRVEAGLGLALEHVVISIRDPDRKPARIRKQPALKEVGRIHAPVSPIGRGSHAEHNVRALPEPLGAGARAGEADGSRLAVRVQDAQRNWLVLLRMETVP